ncbi:MAG: hypothetical protein ABW221_13920 [Vicinamibacteria bacterium]
MRVRYGALTIAAGLTLSTCQDFRPASAAAPAPTGEQDRAQRADWARRQMLESYDRVGKRDPRWDALARTAIELSLPAALATVSRPPSPESRVAAGRAALQAGCDDPLVLHLLARALQDEDVQAAEPEELYRRAVEGMKTVPYARAIARDAATSLYELYAKRIEGLGLRAPLADLEWRWFQESLADGSYGPDDEPVLLWQFRTSEGGAFAKRVPAQAAQAVEGAPWVDRWLRLYLSGWAHYQAAWKGRGTSFAREVKPEQWEVFRRENALARRDLEESHRLRPDRPETCGQLMTLAGDDPQPGQTERMWFDRAVAAQLDFIPAWSGYWNRLLPRWGGSYAQMLALGREALETGRFDTDVPAQLLEVVHRIQQDQAMTDGASEGGAPIFERPEVYPLLVRMFEGFLAEPRRAGERALWHGQWAVAADRARRPAEALAHLDAAGLQLERPVVRFLVREKETPDAFKVRVVVAASPAAADVAEGERLAAAYDVAGALAAYRAAAAKDPSAHLAQAIAGPRASLEAEQRLAAGGWVPFLPTEPHLHGWHDELGSWRVDTDGSLVGRAGSLGLLLVSNARVGADFEVRGRVELVSSTNGAFQGGVAFGRPTWTGKEWIAFRVKRNAREGTVAYSSCHFEKPLVSAVPAPVRDSTSFTLRVQDGRVTTTANGAPVETGLVPERGLVRDRDVKVALGGYVDENVVELRFRDVAVRRLPAASASR